MNEPSRTPIDDAARRRVRHDHGASLFIEAGAGTGKTTALVDRVVTMVVAGVLELRHLAAITFTEAAASELRDRIRSELEAARAGTDPWDTDDDAARARCEAALDQLDEAALTTLHGFASRILGEHPLEAGLPPGFELLDDVEARVAFDQHWSAFVDDLFDDRTLEHVLLTGVFLGLRLDSLRAVARELHENHDRLPLDPATTPELPSLRIDELLAALDAVIDRRAECTDPEDKLAAHVDRLVAYRDRLAAAGDHLDRLELLAGDVKLAANFGQNKNWSCDVNVVRDACAAADEARAAVLDGQRRGILEVLALRVVGFVREYADERRRQGRVEFHDLLVLARSVLRADAEVRAAVADRYRVVLLDEFQDTDPLQIQIAVLLATDADDPGRRVWSDLPIRAGALSVVGDPKQSIYRFRRADLRVYDAARSGLGLDPVTLSENFRSVPGVIDFVNHVFSRVLADAVPGEQAAHVELHAHRRALDGSPAVRVFGDAADALVSEIRDDEAADVAALVRQIKREQWLVADPVDGALRPANYRDVALLIPSRTVLPALEDALDAADIPARVESQSLVFSTAEVRDLVSILTAIDDPTDELAVVASLRSPAFGCSDAQLVDYALAGGRWDYRRPRPDAIPSDGPVAVALDELRGYWEQRWWRSVSETVEAVVRERRLLELAVDRKRPRDHWRRIRFFCDQARAWDDAGDASLRSFVEWVQTQADERARVSESVAPEPDDDAIRILTVHGAKGLEFPVVVLAGLNTQPPYRTMPVVWGPDGPEYAIGTKSSGTRVVTRGYDEQHATERRLEEAERVRLLYVAMTRARDYLLVSLHHKEGSMCHGAVLASHLDGAPFTPIDAADDAAEPADAEPPPVIDPAGRPRWIAARERVLVTAGRPAAVAATTLAREAASPATASDPGLDKERADEVDEPPWRRGRAGTALGRAVHAVLQSVDLATGAGLDDTARAQALAEGVADRESEVRALARSALGAPVVRTAVESGWDWWREVPVATAVDSMLVEGFVDLLLRAPDGSFTVVDWKTDRAPSDAELDAAVARYSVQGAAYAVALEQTLRAEVGRCVFVFARSREPIERDVPDLVDAMTAVREQVATLARV